MKKAKIVLAALLLGLGSLHAQNKLDKVNITYGEELPDDKQALVEILGEANGKIYGVGLKKDDYFLKIFDGKSMKLLSSSPIKLPDLKDKEVEFENIYLLNGKLYALGSVYNRKEKAYSLVATPLSEAGKLGTDGTVLFKVPVEKKSEMGSFFFRTTQDEAGLLVMHAAKIKKEDAVNYQIKFFDDNLTTIFDTTEKVVFEDDKKKEVTFNIPDFQVGLNDDIYVVVNEGYRDKKSKKRFETFEVHAYKSTKGYAKEVITINSEGRYPQNCQIVPSGNELHLMGFYLSVDEKGRVNQDLEGVYAATIDLKTNTTTALKFNQFDQKTKAKLIGERRAKKDKDVAPMYNIIHVIGRADGGMTILSEFQMRMVGQGAGIGIGGVGVGVSSITYVKASIIVTSLSADGTHEWSNVVPKAQVATVSTMFLGLGAGSISDNFSVGGAIAIPIAQMGSGPEYLGALPIYKNGELSIMFNDNVKNKGITNGDDMKKMDSPNKAVPTLFIFDKDGNFVRKDPEEAVKDALVLRPGVSYEVSDNEYIIYSSRKKADKLGRMVLED
ncbi:hypothetical protein OGH69_04785 [Flavobacterium sp. MFBS3-15]|uniref:hypothetical protein n=1 Tax=Flavobacterium sp. MFBS3-15 TaxID=2989816 RepID=UPI002236C16B|nr:hypothetical protein [Flavobacterium sp. MFBS3-15]MCW4468274.1 hypothetical protein [Flavobacterium sp. MFBS3-15]